jgi:prepilin-type N-terminal cleavage/methylation domain-containing protein
MAGTLRYSKPSSRAYSLIELVLVVALLAVAAMITLPNTAPVAQSRVDAAAAEVAQALRFAQSEAIRTGAARVASLDPATSHVRVFQLDMSAKPPTEDLANAVYYPVNRQQKYDFGLSDMPASTGVKIASAVFTFSDGSVTTQLGFDATGAPVNVRGPKPTDAKALTGVGKIDVALGGVRRSVNVDEATGRVTLSS